MGSRLNMSRAAKASNGEALPPNEGEPATRLSHHQLEVLPKNSDRCWKFRKMLKTYTSITTHRSYLRDIEARYRMSDSKVALLAPKVLNYGLEERDWRIASLLLSWYDYQNLLQTLTRNIIT